MRNILYAKIKEKGLVDNSAIYGFVDSAELNNKGATIAELKAEQDEIIKF